MKLNDDEIKYKELISTLGNLQKIKAPANFEDELRRKLSGEKYHPAKTFWDKLFISSKLIPSAGLAAAALIIFFVITVNSEEMEDPFLIEPRIREDIYEIEGSELMESVGKVETEEIDKNVGDKKSVFKEKDQPLERRDMTGRRESVMEESKITDEEVLASGDNIESDSMQSDMVSAPSVNEPTTEIAAGLAITKEELNFRQVQLNEQEQKVVDQLRQKVQFEGQEKKKID